MTDLKSESLDVKHGRRVRVADVQNCMIEAAYHMKSLSTRTSRID